MTDMTDFNISQIIKEELKHGKLKEKVHLSLDEDQYKIITDWKGNLTDAEIARAIYNLGTVELLKRIKKFKKNNIKTD